MTTEKDVVDALKKLPKLKGVKVAKLRDAVKKMISSLSADLIHVKTTKRLEILPHDFWQASNEFGYEDEEYIEFIYNGRTYEVAVEDLTEKKGIKYFEIVTSKYLCPLCRNEIVIVTIGGRIVSGGYSSQYYNGESSQDMCHECSKKISKERYG